MKNHPTAKITISRWFSRKYPLVPSDEKIKILADILKVPIEKITSLEEDNKHYKDICHNNEDIVSIPKLSFYAGASRKGIINHNDTDDNPLINKPNAGMAEAIYKVVKMLNLERQIEILTISTNALKDYMAQNNQENIN